MQLDNETTECLEAYSQKQAESKQKSEESKLQGAEIAKNLSRQLEAIIQSKNIDSAPLILLGLNDLQVSMDLLEVTGLGRKLAMLEKMARGKNPQLQRACEGLIHRWKKDLQKRKENDDQMEPVPKEILKKYRGIGRRIKENNSLASSRINNLVKCHLTVSPLWL